MTKLIKIFIIFSCLLLSLNSNAKNLAIIIGNDAYKNVGKLDNPVRDAKLVASKFEGIGYETRLSKNLDEFNFNKLLKSIARESSNYDVTVIYYAGHAVQLGGLNYMLAVDQLPPKTEEDIKLSAVLMDDLIQSIKSPLKVVLMDACRDNPLIQKTLSVSSRGLLSRGLAPPSRTSGGLFVAYATASGSVAMDGVKENNSPFAKALANNLSRPESIDDMFSRVTKEVLQNTNNTQRPFKYASLEDKFCLPGPCDSFVAINDPSPVIEKKIQPKIILKEEIFKIKNEKLRFFSDFVTYAFTDSEVYQFQASSFTYNPKTKIAITREKIISNVTGLASIFSVNDKYTVTTNLYNCEDETYVYEEISKYNSDGSLIKAVKIDKKNQIKIKNVPRTSKERAFKTFCNPDIFSLNSISGTNRAGRDLYGIVGNNSFYWDSNSKILDNNKTYYAVFNEYKNSLYQSKLDEYSLSGIILAAADCNDPSKADHVATLLINKKGKANRIVIFGNELIFPPDDPGYKILTKDCQG